MIQEAKGLKTPKAAEGNFHHAVLSQLSTTAEDQRQEKLFSETVFPIGNPKQASVSMSTPLDKLEKGSEPNDPFYSNKETGLNHSNHLKPTPNSGAEDPEVRPPSPMHNQQPISPEQSSRQGFDHRDPKALESPLPGGDEDHYSKSWEAMAPYIEENPSARAPSVKRESDDILPPPPFQEPGDMHEHPGLTSADEDGVVAPDITMEGRHSQAQPKDNTSVDMQRTAPDSLEFSLEASALTVTPADMGMSGSPPLIFPLMSRVLMIDELAVENPNVSFPPNAGALLMNLWQFRVLPFGQRLSNTPT